MRRALLIALPLLLTLPGAGGRSLADAPDGGSGGTGLTVQVGEAGETTVTVTHGELKVKAGGQETHVKRGQRVRARRGEPAHVVLAAPEPSEPLDGAHLPKLGVALVWRPVAGAQSYKVTVASDAELKAVVWDGGRIDQPRARVELKGAGTYYWRVTPVGAKEIEGRSSAVRSFTIDLTPPRLKAGKPSWK